ncbi:MULTISPECIES: DNA cytosine methyltransferase [Anaerofustis]|uniref:DNA cytosine methyltransferase n=1 Tax=Anaerofustis TaxID=264995 RepID=UPI0011062815|nr:MULTISPECIES: DNA cytosine methyltransferase [Anaerofustis]MCO8194415.1 DNA cytosine methyltransferase [Anaerofustis sp. NSJ-163]
MDIRAIDLFCGAGGLTCGLKESGINVVAGIDFNEYCKFPFEFNNKAKFIHSKIEDINAEELMPFYKNADIKVLVGCAPCQPFSKHTTKIRNKKNKKDEKWYLINHFKRLINELKPDIISMENVPLLSQQQIFKSFINNLKKEGFFISWDKVYCPDYGIPQSRTRLVLLASKIGKIELMPKTRDKDNYITVREIIGDLEPLEAGAISRKDPLHRARNFSKKNLERIKQSKPGGTWKDWDEDLICECHKKDSGKSYSSVYARMEWDKPSPTITTQFTSYGTGRFGHPEQNRALSFREGALLQTFPKKYKFFKDEIPLDEVGKMIGNAVPVTLGKVIGESIISHLEVYYDKK